MKLTAWNVEWLDHSFGVADNRYTPGRRRDNRTLPSVQKAENQLGAVAREIELIAPDILLLCEGVKGEQEMQAFVAARLPGFDLVMRPAGQPYHVSGSQWLWFLVRKGLSDLLQPELLDIDVWRRFAALSSPSARPDGRWAVAMPRLVTFGDVKDVPVSTRVIHRYHRHPQTLRFRLGGQLVEIIGAHLKSKFTSGKPAKRSPGQSLDDYLKVPSVAKYIAGAHAARIKLTSEAQNVRAYIDQRFAQESAPAVIVAGDLNDGPGKELLEREYLLHDLIGNLQGDVFRSEQFLNHALFDQPRSLRWTVRFRDPLEPDRDPDILLDHILFTQAFTRSGTGPLLAKANSGLVEHRIHEEVEAEFGAGAASDHRPVSVSLADRASA